jgi:uncharacterized protein involved in exopolysaccharide biosynthesis
LNQVPNQTEALMISDLWDLILSETKFILSTVTLCAALALIFAISSRNIYRAEVVLAPAEFRQSASPLASQLGGAAALVGINVGVPEDGRISSAIAIIQSREFIRNFIANHNLLVPIFAGYWDAKTSASKIDSSVYDEANVSWTNANEKPTDPEAFRKFRSQLRINQDPITGLVRITFDWHDPILAASWVNQIVRDLNRELKLEDVYEANNAIEYLEKQLESTQLVEMQRVFYQLIETQTRVAMLADVREEYVFKVIDPAVVPDQPISPRRLLILMVGIVFGVFISTLLLLIRKLR